MVGTLVGCARYLVVSEHGLLAYWKLKEEINQKKAIITEFENDINQLQASIHAFENDPFEKERIARQDLQLGYKYELVYVLHKNSSF